MTTALLLGVAAVIVLTWLPRRPTNLRREYSFCRVSPYRRLQRREHPGGTAGLDRPGRALRRTVEAVTAGRRSRPPDVGAVISEVASRLRAGAPTEAAWSAAVDRALGASGGTGPGGGVVAAFLRVGSSCSPKPDPTRSGKSSGAASAGLSSRHSPSVDELPSGVAAVPLPSGLRRLTEHCRGDPVTEQAVRAVTAATLLSHTLGAPLAEVLDRCAEAVVEAERAHDARRVALAGPRSTARILTGLPVLGVVLGAGLGADPLAAATDGGWGTLAVACGILLLLAGGRWSGSLVRAAESPVSERGLLRRRTPAAVSCAAGAIMTPPAVGRAPSGVRRWRS